MRSMRSKNAMLSLATLSQTQSWRSWAMFDCRLIDNGLALKVDGVPLLLHHDSRWGYRNKGSRNERFRRLRAASIYASTQAYSPVP